MEEFVQAVGVVGMILLALTGLLAGWVASLAAGGRHRGRYLLIGLIGALAAPLVLLALGVTVLAASGLVAILAAALIGAVIVLVIARLIFD
ncbi:GlsB/YeaQ/YmgE family stress response membrane protein [Cereibacter sphaeroides]|uniref:GlsB/YeaQ/YmgE family stress response membrane protein n=1 Tax=Cereibacter sphaeroides TaxID=1063 RepID=UPI001F2AD83F|nr:GlsB/YeaQ/YmgE family stress response membrane protein [Cereibacter sphaeroides]MCE6950107.1 GlsB/YeaQ/YmgE family stress response membrane protein [Cereibacter sphaeroides]